MTTPTCTLIHGVHYHEVQEARGVSVANDVKIRNIVRFNRGSTWFDGEKLKEGKQFNVHISVDILETDGFWLNNCSSNKCQNN